MTRCFLDDLFDELPAKMPDAESRDSFPEILEPADLPAEWLELFNERAAIREYDGGQDRETAEGEAFTEVLGRMRREKKAGNRAPCDANHMGR